MDIVEKHLIPDLSLIVRDYLEAKNTFHIKDICSTPYWSYHSFDEAIKTIYYSKQWSKGLYDFSDHYHNIAYLQSKKGSRYVSLLPIQDIP